MYFTNDPELIDDFHVKSGHSLGSIRSYQSVFNNYRKFHNMSLCELIAEAIAEQENHTPQNRLSIYDRILSFRDYLVKNNIGNTVTNSYLKSRHSTTTIGSQCLSYHH